MHNLQRIPMNSYQHPDPSGHFGPYGGSFVSETLTHAIQELRETYARYQNDPAFLAEFHYELKHFVGRPSPVYHAARTSREMGGAQIYLKREDLNHTGAHKINNVIGQGLLTKRMGKTRVIAETGAGQHGVATATIAALLGFWLAQVIARRVTGAVQNLNTAARALVDGASFTLPRLQLKEAESVGQALQQASEILQRTRHAALHDPLTGLSNRARFLDLLHQQLENTSLRQQPFAVMMLDLDGLKRINDEAGHVTGDQALKATAQRIRATLPADGTAARLGGDEFGLLLPSADRAQAHATALRLLTALAEPDDLYPHPIAVGIGVALWPSAGRDATALIEAADNALYAAKRDDNGHLAFAPALPH